MAYQPELSLKLQKQIAFLGILDAPASTVVPTFRSDYPISIMHHQEHLDTVRADLATGRANEAKAEEKRSDMEQGMNGHNKVLSPEELQAQRAKAARHIQDLELRAEDDTLEFLGIELFRRTETINRDDRPVMTEALRGYRLSFTETDPDERRTYLKFLGGLVTGTIDQMHDEARDFRGPVYDARFDEFRQFTGFVIGNTTMQLPDVLSADG